MSEALRNLRTAADAIWLVVDSDDVGINVILASPEGLRRAVLAADYGTVRVFHLN
jgi:hypothetical protein